MTAIKSMDETKLAEEIVSVLEPSALRACSPESDVIRFAVRSGAMKLRTIIFNRAALRRLLSDTAALVKVDYLKRDLLRVADQRSEYRYPRAAVARIHRPAIEVLASRKVGAF
jgi:hypothetical protein